MTLTAAATLDDETIVPADNRTVTLNHTTVDAQRDTITFAGPHNFQTGDPVRLDTLATFNPSTNVDSQAHTIKLAADPHLTTGDPVTYHTAAAPTSARSLTGSRTTSSPTRPTRPS